MDKFQMIVLCIGLISSACLCTLIFMPLVRKILRDRIKAKIIEKHGYPPAHCDALGDAYEDDIKLKKLRDKFAGEAMSSLIRLNHAPEQDGTDVMTVPDTAFWAYRYADAMLKARRKKEVSNG